MKILCIDDEELVLELTVKICKELNGNPEVYGFSSAKQILDYLDNNEADIAILDINMPDMDGLELAMKIKEKQSDIAVMFLTGYDEYAVEAFKVHPVGYLMKPLDADSLQEQVDYVESMMRGGERPIEKENGLPVVRTFGEFEVFVNGEPISFLRQKSKELFAYLIDRQGGMSQERRFTPFCGRIRNMTDPCKSSWMSLCAR